MAEIILNKKHPLYQEDLERILQIPGVEKFKGNSFLITGATGLIGVCLIDALMAYNRQGADIHIYAVGRNKESAMSRLGDYFLDRHFHFIEQDVREPLPLDLFVNYIIPLASNTHPMAYSQYPIETIEINVKGAENALIKAEKCGAMVLYPSSVEVYGNARGKDVFDENYTGRLNLGNARACYPESKRLCEAMCQSYISERSVNVKILRLSRVFGPTVLNTDTKASSQFIKKAIENSNIVLKSKGEQCFSYTYVADVVRALFYVALHGEVGSAYNISSKACNVKLKDFAEECANWANTEIVYELPSETEQKGYSVAMHAILDNSRLTHIGFTPLYSFNEAIHRTLDIIWGYR